MDVILDRVVGHSRAMQVVNSLVRKVAPHDCAVLIHGESGTGKELIARSIQENSKRRGGPFLTVNCGAIPDALTESILFGHEKGAFTGASTDKRGLFESANGGTVFLDEIGEMPLSMQVKLLRALQEKEIVRVGSTKPIKIDVRVLAATNRDLKGMISEGQFRQDLYYRIATFEIKVSPLRHRREDIPLLVHHFLNKYSNQAHLEQPITIEEDALNALLAYDWPGNVRELDNMVQRLIVIAGDRAFTRADVEGELGTPSGASIVASDTPHRKPPEAKLILPSLAAEFAEDEDMNSYIRRVRLYALTAALKKYTTKTAAAARLGLTKESLKKQLRCLRRSAARPTTITESQEDL